MQDLGKIMVIAGVVIIVAGLLIWKTGGLGPLGRLPGDISIKGEHSSFYFPVMTCILISIVLSLLSWIFRR
jgi:Protein of unknown function (DUF2905)